MKIASLLDLAGTKASVIPVGAEAKDYLDMDAVLKQRLVDAVRQVDLDHLPALDRNSLGFDDDHGQEL